MRRSLSILFALTVGACAATPPEPPRVHIAISVDWEGNIYDCDFNQMLEIPTDGGLNKLWTFTPQQLIARRIQVADHCYGCTAGAGSSCGGEVI